MHRVQHSSFSKKNYFQFAVGQEIMLNFDAKKKNYEIIELSIIQSQKLTIHQFGVFFFFLVVHELFKTDSKFKKFIHYLNKFRHVHENHHFFQLYTMH